MTSSAYPLSSMNIGVMDILNFLDKKHADQPLPYHIKCQQNALLSYEDDTRENAYPERRESRIPVAVRRLRSRSDRTAISAAPANDNNLHQRLNNDVKNDDWQIRTNEDHINEPEPKSKHQPRLLRKKSSIPVQQTNNDNMTAMRVKNGNGQELMCPKCGRSCIMINREGVYIAFSIGITPLVLLCLFLMCVFFGWLGLGYGVGPALLRRLRLPDTAERERSRNNWISKWLAKPKH